MLTSDAIVGGLGTREIPGPVYVYTTLDSTMDEARRLLAENPDAGALLVVAEEQTAGRGRVGRSWQAPVGSALLFTLALRPHWLPPAPWHRPGATRRRGALRGDQYRHRDHDRPQMAERSAALGTECANGRGRPQDAGQSKVATSDATSCGMLTNVRYTDPAEDNLPWAKAGGILLESNVVGEQFDFALIGCGLNISASPPLAKVRYPATSVGEALGGAIDRLAVLRAILVHFDAWYIRLAQGDYEPLFAAWRKQLLTIGNQVRIETAQGMLEGRAEAVAIDGSLLLRSSDGRLHTIYSGDVGVLGKPTVIFSAEHQIALYGAPRNLWYSSKRIDTRRRRSLRAILVALRNLSPVPLCAKGAETRRYAVF
ncbi:biotin--[acetyl-CoA-carboxylase] ligase [Candidatus Gracilibacteria bacterium]|nr:biotin--[acetyl-CoA-carboxylase] ligase [Candidatus Gracilibacteria bacterium]